MSTDDRKRLPLLRIGLSSAFVVVLGWQILGTTLAAYLADANPDAALRFDPGNPDALLAIAQRKLDVVFGGGVVAPRSLVTASGRVFDGGMGSGPREGRLKDWSKIADPAFGAKTAPGGPIDDRVPAEPQATANPSTEAVRAEPGEAVPASRPPPLPPELKAAADEIRALAAKALINDPTSAAAYRILGQIASQAGDDLEAKRFMEAAVQRSLRESIAHYWLMRDAVDAQAFDRAVFHGDAILRVRPQLANAVVPLLALIAETPKGSDVVRDLLGQNPPWRSLFLRQFLASIRDARTPLTILLHLKGTSAPPTKDELREYLKFLISKKFYDLAYNTWLQFLPDDQLAAAGYLFNGRFQFPPSDSPFDWSISARSGVIAEIVAVRSPLAAGGDQAADGRALMVELHSGQIDFPGVSQTIIVRPGTYQFKGRYRGILTGRRGLKWHVTCLDQPGTRIGESQMMLSGSSAWQPFDFGFKVAQTGCGAQSVRLELDARSASERLVTGSMWFSDLEIVPDKPAIAEPLAGQAATEVPAKAVEVAPAAVPAAVPAATPKAEHLPPLKPKPIKPAAVQTPAQAKPEGFETTVKPAVPAAPKPRAIRKPPVSDAYSPPKVAPAPAAAPAAKP